MNETAIEADLTGSASQGQTPSQLELENAIESFAGHFAVEHRVEETVAEGAARGAYRITVEDTGLAVHRPPLINFAA